MSNTPATANSHLTLGRAVAGALTGFGPRVYFDREGTTAPPAPAKPADAFKSMREEFTRLHGEANGVIETAARDSRELTADEKSANDTRFNRMTTIKTTLDEQAKFAGLALAGNAPANVTVTTPTDAPGRAEFEAAAGGDVAAGKQKIDREQFSKALTEWARTGVMPRQFATITTATQGGALLPKEVTQPVVVTYPTALRQALALYGIPAMKTTSTAEVNVPVVIAAAGSDVSETANAGTENVPSLTESINLKPTPIQSGQVWVSNLELAALDYDLLNSLVPSLQDAKEMRLEQKAMAAIIADAAVTQEVATATTNGITYANLVALNNKLATRFDRLKVIILSPAAYTAAVALTDSQGRPILVADTQNQTLLRFNGTPVLKSDYLEAFGASKVVGLLISLVAFKLRDAGDGEKLIRHVNDKDKVDQTGMNVVGYHAWGYAPSAVVKLKTPAS